MTKPASELIALADELSFAAENTQGCLYSQRKMLHAAAGHIRTAANQSGSERARVDALRDVLQHALAFYDKLDRPHAAGEAKLLDEMQAALATPPAQPAPASDYDYETNDPMGVVRNWPSEAPSTHGKPDGAVLPKRPFAFAVRRAPENGADQWRLFMDESEARAEAEQLDGDYEALFRVGDRRSVVDALTVTAQVASAVRVWLECPAEKRPSAQALGNRVAEIAALSPKIAAADDTETCIACNTAFVEGDMVYPDASGGCIHASCCGPERESYVNADGEPLKDGDPLPTPQRWTGATAETSPGDVEARPSDHAPSNLLFYGLADAIGLSATLRFNTGGTIKHEFDRNGIKQLRDSLRPKAEAKSQEPVAVAVKPLEWESPDDELGRAGMKFEATGIDRVYYLLKTWHGQLGEGWRIGYVGDSHYPTLDEAKAAVQADYEQRIRSALIPTTKPEAPAVSVDAIKAALAPFAKVADLYAEQEDGSFRIFADADVEAINLLTVDNCRKAREVEALIDGER